MQKIPFLKKERELQLRICTIPQHVSALENPDSESYEQVVRRQDKFLSLPKVARYKLASSDTGKRIELIGQKYQFDLLRLANITRLVREHYFGEVRLENFPAEIERRMGVSAFTAQEIARYLKSEIIDWDPWAEYAAQLPKMNAREIVQNRPKLADMKITDGYIQLKNSEELEDPTIKNWVRDYVMHLGHERHSQMQRTQYLFHSQNGRNLSSPDREKLGIILRSFDENVPLPVDGENEEIIFDGMIAEPRPTNIPSPATTSIPKFQSAPEPSFVPPSGTTAGKQEFIKPYAPARQPQRPTLPPRPAPPLPPLRPSGTSPRAGEEEKELRNPAIDKYFNAPESPDIPGIKIQSITEHNESKNLPQVNIQRPPTSPRPSPYKGEGAARPRHKIIDPYSKPMPEPKLDGNIVDLSNKE